MAALACTALGGGWYFGLAPASADLPVVAQLGGPGPELPRRRAPNLALDMIFTADGEALVTRQEDGQVMRWTIATGQARKLGRTEGAFAFCPARELLLVGDAGRRIVIEDGSDRRIRVAGANGDHAAWSADCSRFALVESEDRTIEIRHTRDHGLVARGTSERPPRNGMAFAPDGRRVAIAAGTYRDRRGHRTRLDLYDDDGAGGFTLLRSLGDDEVILGIWRTAFLGGSDHLVTAAQVDGDAGLRVFGLAPAATVWQRDGFDAYWVRALAVSADGAFVASGDEKGWLRLWDGKSGAKLGERNAGQVIQSLALSPDGTRVAAGLWDGTVIVARRRDIVP